MNTLMKKLEPRKGLCVMNTLKSTTEKTTRTYKTIKQREDIAMRISLRILAVLLVATLSLAAGLSDAAIITWDGSEDTVWDVADNWTPSGIPGVDDVADIANVTDQPIKSSGAGDLIFDDGGLILQPGAEATIGSHLRFALDSGEESLSNSVGLGAILNVNGIGGSGSWSSIGNAGNASLDVSGTADFDGNLGLAARHDGVGGSGFGTVTIQTDALLDVGGILRVNNASSVITGLSDSELTVGSNLELINGADLVLASDMKTFTVGQHLTQTGNGHSSIPLPDGADITEYLRVGYDSTSTATVTMGSGASDDTLDVNGTTSNRWSNIGNKGSATFNVTGIADFDGNLGLGVRHDGVGGSGFGTVTIQTDAFLDVGGILRVNNESSEITGLSGSELTVGSNLELTNGADLDLASDMTTFTVGQHLTQAGTGHSSIPLPDGAVITKYLRVGHDSNSTATVTMGNTLDVNGTTDTGGTWSYIGRAGSASLAVTGIADFAGNLGLGVRHDGLNQSGSGTLTVESTGSLDVDGELRVRGTAGSTFAIIGGNASIEVDGYTQDLATSTLDLDIDSTGISAINVDGTVTLLAAGTLLDVEFVSGYAPAVDDVFDVIINDGGDSVSGIFENIDNVDLTEGTEWFVDSFIGADTVGLEITYLGAYTGGSDNDIQLLVTSVVPEPATMSLLAIGGLGVLLRRRRRRA